MDDAELVGAAAAGDRAAFAAIYDAHADRVYDVCCTVLGDRDEAADAMQDTFLLAGRHLKALRDPSRLRPWLLAIARHEAIRRGRKRSRAVPTAEVETMTGAIADDDLPSGLATEAARDLVAAAADGLGERDRAILALHLRQGLEGQDLADALGVSLSQSYVLMSRLRDQIDRSLGALLVAHDGAGECDELAAILRGWDGQYTPLLRKRVARHLDRCAACGDRRKNLLPLALVGAIPFVAAPAYAREAILAGVELGAATTSPRGWRADGFPRADKVARPRRRRILEIAIGAAVALAILIAGASTVRELDARDERDIAASSSSAASTSSPSSSTSAPPGAAGATTIAPSGTPTTTLVPSIPAGPGTTTPTTVPGPGTTVPPPPAVTALGWNPKTLGVTGCADSVLNLTATVSGVGPLTVEVRYVDTLGDKGSAPLSFDGASWVGKIGPFEKAGTVTFSIVATDARNQSSTSSESSVAVQSC